MIQKKIVLALLLFGLMSCENEVPNQVLFGELFDLNKVDSIEVRNNQGRHLLNNEKQVKFKAELNELILVKGGSFKMGSVGFSLFVKGQEIIFSGRTHGEYFETHAKSIMRDKNWAAGEWVYFGASKMNLDNY